MLCLRTLLMIVTIKTCHPTTNTAHSAQQTRRETTPIVILRIRISSTLEHCPLQLLSPITFVSILNSRVLNIVNA